MSYCLFSAFAISQHQGLLYTLDVASGIKQQVGVAGSRGSTFQVLPLAVAAMEKQTLQRGYLVQSPGVSHYISSHYPSRKSIKVSKMSYPSPPHSMCLCVNLCLEKNL